jgi:hypothetical protein
MNKILLMLGVLVLAAMIALPGCAPDKLQGTLKENQRPTIDVTNIHYNDSLFTFNAVINWYGIDPDGQVIHYYYIVKDSATVGTDPDSYLANTLSQSEITDWTQTDETAATIQMLASDSETDTLNQYVFFTCEDNDGAFSDTLYYALYRVNRIPQTYISLLPGNFTNPGNDTIYTVPVWSLPDTNSLWTGLSFTWNGEDTLDFPSGSPDFQYTWEIYGPYDTANYSYDDSTVHLGVDDLDPDSLYIVSCADADKGYVLASQADHCHERWVWNKAAVVTNLPTGCYIAVVTVRDDAEVPDDTPAWGSFIVIEPDWTNNSPNLKDIVVVQSTQYTPGHNHGWVPQEVTINDSTYSFPDINMAFYSAMIESAGDYEYDIYGVPALGGNTKTDFPTMYDLAHYRMIIVDDADYLKIELGETDQHPFVPVLMGYLTAGGKVWVIGRQCLYGNSNQPQGGYFDFDATSLGYLYFDLSAVRFAPINIATEYGEFVGATSVYGNFPSLNVDNDKAFGYFNQYGINKVEALLRNGTHSTTLYTYNAANPDTMALFEAMPCAVRYYPTNHVFKSSYFSFPLILLDDSDGQVRAIFDDMLYWFLGY